MERRSNPEEEYTGRPRGDGVEKLNLELKLRMSAADKDEGGGGAAGG
jgi:hypothetical protein